MSHSDAPRAAGSLPGDERRQSPRFDALGRILGLLVAVDLPVRVRDVGLGGFSVETVEPLDVGGVLAVRFLTADDWVTDLQARSLHCRPSVATDGTPRYVTGFEFLRGQAADASGRVRELVAKVTSVELFDEPAHD